MAKKGRQTTTAKGSVYRKGIQLDLFAHVALDAAEDATASTCVESPAPDMCGDRWIDTGSPWPLAAGPDSSL